MVNSGSSANLLALSILSNPSLGSHQLKKGDEVIIISYASMDLSNAKIFKPTVVFPGANNSLQ